MTKHTIETVTFKLTEGVTREAFLETVPALSAFVRARPGFISRRLSCSEDGLWIEHIEWATLEDARSAAADLSSTASLRPFLTCIDEPTVRMHHTELQVSLD